MTSLLNYFLKIEFSVEFDGGAGSAEEVAETLQCSNQSRSVPRL